MDYHNNAIGRDVYAPKLKVRCEWNWGFACVNEEVVGPSLEDTKEMYKDLAAIAVGFNDKDQLKKDPNPPGITVGSGGIRFTYCVLNTDDFDGQIPRVPYDYIVLRMDTDCPEGTYPFHRRHDTEDSDNNNSSSGSLGPNSVTKNAVLEYCFVPADENSSLEYPFDENYGVFANYSS